MNKSLLELREKALGMTLLYVEDDEGIVSIFEEILKIIFPCVLIARNGEEGLKLYKEHSPDIVMTDIYMPIMDGLEMARLIKSDHVNASIIVTSAYSQADEFLRSIEVGIDGYVVKPFTKDRLFGAIEKVLDTIISARQLKEYHDLIENILTHVADGVVVTNSSSVITFVNPALCQMLGYETNELIGCKPSLFKSDRYEKEFYGDMWKSLLHDGKWQGEIVNRRKNGEEVIVETDIVALHNSHGETISYIGTCRDVTQHKHTMNEVNYQAMHDPLTGAYNRQYLERMRLDDRNKVYSLMMIDVDGFKNINDFYGHAVGDQVLVELAKGFEDIVRKSDTVIRYGGDEFMVVLEDMIDSSLIEKIAKRMIEFVEIVNDRMIKDVTIGISIGVGISRDGETFGALYERADAAMYQIKKEGKNNFLISFCDL